MSQVSTEDPSMCLCLHPQSAKMHLTLSLQRRFAKGHLSEPVSVRRQPGHLSMWFGVGMAGTRDTQHPLNTNCWCFTSPSINPEPEQSPNGSVPNHWTISKDKIHLEIPLFQLPSKHAHVNKGKCTHPEQVSRGKGFNELNRGENWLARRRALAGSPGPGQGHSLETCFNQIALKKQKGKSFLRSLTLGHLKDEGANCMIYWFRGKKRGWKQTKFHLRSGK